MHDEHLNALIDKEVEEFRNRLEIIHGHNNNNNHVLYGSNTPENNTKMKLPVAPDVFMAAVVGVH